MGKDNLLNYTENMNERTPSPTPTGPTLRAVKSIGRYVLVRSTIAYDALERILLEGIGGKGESSCEHTLHGDPPGA